MGSVPRKIAHFVVYCISKHFYNCSL